MSKQQKISIESKSQGDDMPTAMQKPGQKKAQAKLITIGIEKGIAEYKKQHKAKMREQDKLRKRKVKAQLRATPECEPVSAPASHRSWLPWILLLGSWLTFAGYLWFDLRP